MSDYALRIVLNFADAVMPALHDDERPRLVERAGVVGPEHPHLVVKPGKVNVFINPAHRMIVLRGDEYRPDLCRKINEGRYSPAYMHAPVIGSQNSEDATTWSFLRTMEMRCRPEWITRALAHATGIHLKAQVTRVSIRYWFGRVTDDRLPIPPGLNETATELDALIEFHVNRTVHLVSVEAKIGYPFSGSQRDQFLRTIDVGSYYAATRSVELDHYWALAILPQRWTGRTNHDPHSVVARYKGNPNNLGRSLTHRRALAGEVGRLTDEDLALLASHVGVVSWEEIIQIGRETCDPDLRVRTGPWP